MGLFNFIKDIGKELINKAGDQGAVETSLRDAVAKAQLGIQDFQLKYAGGLATLSGLASSQKDLELARLIIGNHKGVDKVNDDALKLAPVGAAAAPAAAAPTAIPLVDATTARQGAGATAARMVTVKSGDTLSKIAKEYLGNGNLYPELVAANQPMIKNADEIYPGQVIRVPETSASLH